MSICSASVTCLKKKDLFTQIPNDWTDSIFYGCLYEGHYARHQGQRFKRSKNGFYAALSTTDLNIFSPEVA